MANERLYKIVGTDDSDGLNGCPTVMGLDGPVASVTPDEVLVQGRKLTPKTGPPWT